ncbi:MAG: IS4 family transposase, partial [Anaerolineae bacterium]
MSIPVHLPELLPVFQELLPSRLIQEWLRKSERRFYQRLFTPLVTLWGLIFQRLNPDHSCDAALAHISSGAVDDLDAGHDHPLSQRIRSESTAAYCKARQRLPLSVLQEALCHTASVIQEWSGTEGQWRGHTVHLLDGSTLRARPTPELEAHYGHHTNQHGATYWIIIRVVVAFMLFNGTISGVAEGPLHSSEQELAAALLLSARPGDGYVGDRNFGVFSFLQAVRHAGAWALVRLTARRAQALLGRLPRPGEDVRVSWKPSRHDQTHPDMSTDPIEGRLLCVRIERRGFRPLDLYLFTTLLDPERYPLEALAELYGWRWHAELNLRYVKTSLEMEEVAGKSPEMVRKEIWAGLLAYNLLRGVMVQAARRGKVSPLELSFTQCWRRIWQALAFGLRGLAHQAERARQLEQLLWQLLRCRLPQRPAFRIEP